MERKFEVCYMNGTQEDWEWETINQVDTYTEATKLICSDAPIGSGCAIFKNGVRILPNSKEARHELKVDKKEEIRIAMDRIQFSMDANFDFFMYHLDQEEIEEEENKVANAWKTLEKYNIEFTDEIFEKRRVRSHSHEWQPIPFIERTFKRINPDELPL